MSFKAFFFILIILLLGLFLYLKYEVSGDPNSHFNQTTRVTLGEHPVMRTILGLHNAGDERAEYLEGTGPIIIDWSAPEEETIDPTIFTKFSALVEQYTGRQVQVSEGPAIDDVTLSTSNLASYSVESGTQVAGGTTLDVFLTEDYSPRPAGELSSTYRESGILLSLSATRSFIQNYPNDLNQYLLAGMLREFGAQIGLPENSSAVPDPSCIMNAAVGINGQPVEFSGRSVPQDFCPGEQAEIQSIKSSLQ